MGADARQCGHLVGTWSILCIVDSREARTPRIFLSAAEFNHMNGTIKSDMQRVTNLAYVVFWDFTIQLDHPREHLALSKGCKGSQSSQKEMVFHRLNCSRGRTVRVVADLRGTFKKFDRGAHINLYFSDSMN